MTDQAHSNQPVELSGEPLDAARFAVILFHGRGADPSSMRALASNLDLTQTAVLMPTAADGRWYPKGFLLPPAENEPDLSSALAVASTLVARCAAAGIPPERIIIGGFSQGACLATEWVARNPHRYGGVVILSGGLIGAPGQLPTHPGSLDGTPVLAGCSERDPWIPFERFEETVAVLRRMGAVVDARGFEGGGHEIRPDEIDQFNELLQNLKRLS